MSTSAVPIPGISSQVFKFISSAKRGPDEICKQATRLLTGVRDLARKNGRSDVLLGIHSAVDKLRSIGEDSRTDHYGSFFMSKNGQIRYPLSREQRESIEALLESSSEGENCVLTLSKDGRKIGELKFERPGEKTIILSENDEGGLDFCFMPMPKGRIQQPIKGILVEGDPLVEAIKIQFSPSYTLSRI